MRLILADLRSLAILVLGVSISSCASDPKKLLSQQTGIDVCRAAMVKPLRSEHGDVFRFELSARLAECQPSIPLSVVEASKGDCRGLIDLKGSCSYSFGNRTVIAEKMPVTSDVSRYEVRSW